MKTCCSINCCLTPWQAIDGMEYVCSRVLFDVMILMVSDDVGGDYDSTGHNVVCVK